MIGDKESEIYVTVGSCSLRSVILSDFDSMVSLLSDQESEGGCPRLFHEWFAVRQFSALVGFT